jgi:hypothetical protein
MDGKYMVNEKYSFKLSNYARDLIYSLITYSMSDQNATSTEYENTPKEVIANTARFNKQFLNKQLGGNPISVSIGKMLTVISDQDNTIRTLSRILGRDHNDQHLHDMHNELFAGLIGDSSSGREGMDLSSISNQLTTFIHQQNQQIQTLIDEIKKNFEEINSQIQ